MSDFNVAAIGGTSADMYAPDNGPEDYFVDFRDDGDAALISGLNPSLVQYGEDTEELPGHPVHHTESDPEIFYVDEDVLTSVHREYPVENYDEPGWLDPHLPEQRYDQEPLDLQPDITPEDGFLSSSPGLGESPEELVSMLESFRLTNE